LIHGGAVSPTAEGISQLSLPQFLADPLGAATGEEKRG
jgi:hypothetical protein